ncbi:hypothetical protein V2J09_015097 [Rumex salicifolius]
MAPNKFATALNRETNRITIVLVYAVLEWTLIISLLLNSLFSYLIIKFANYFGLKPPCLLCSRLDHIFEPTNSKSSYRDLICEHHAIELSRSGYCSNHRKLVESQDMCEDCWSSHHGDHQHPTTVLAFRWLKEIGMVKSDENCKVVEDCDVKLRCSCCGVGIKNEILAPLTVIKPSLGVLEDTQKVTGEEILDDVVTEEVLEDTHKANIDELPRDVNFLGEPVQNGTGSLDIERKDEDGNERSRDVQMGPYSDLIREDDNLEGFSFCLSKEGYSLVEAYEDEKDVVLGAETEPLLKGSSASVSYSYADEKILPQHLEFYIDFDDYQLIPVDFSDIEMEKSKGGSQNDGEEDQKNRDQEKFNELWRETDEGLVLEPDIMVAPAALDAVEKINASSLDFLELYETKSGELSTKQTPVQEFMREFDIGLESDESKVEGLAIKEDHEAEEIKREVGAAVVIDELKVEILPTIKGQVEVTTKEIDFHVTGDEICDVLLTFSGDQITEKREVTELYANIPTSDFEDVCHKENDEIDIVRSIESIDKSKVAEPLRPCEDECPSNNDDVICKASTITNGLLEIRDYKSMQTEEMQIHKDMAVEVTTKEIDFHVTGAEKCDVLLTFNGDQITEKREVTELNAKIPTSDFEDVCHKENDEIDMVRNNESMDKSDMAEPLGPCEDECPSPNDDAICEASTITNHLLEIRDYEHIQTEETQNHTDMTVEITERELQNDMALSHERNEVEGDIIPETPNPADKLHHSQKEILDCSTANELDNGEEVVRVEELKALLESERKILRALYAELDEERNAASIATNETMAMINRLQEEKATIEMEALQYQRMMEEQCEYDQEALQLMNEMLVKREKQLQELEKELEVCRKKVMEYEERERMRLLSHRKDRSYTKSRTSSASCSNGEESDGLSVDLNPESREEDNGSCKLEENGHHHNTPVDAILDLQDPLGSFEEERISILEQLKVLEEKLCTLAEEEEHHIGDMKPFEQFYEESAKEFDRSFKLNGDANELENGTSAINGIHHQEKWTNGSKPKQLLPLFDATELDSDSELSNSIEDGLDLHAIHKPLPTKFELESKRLAIEEEVDHLYERLHALEADREFVKHCVGSLRKGDKGVNLLQEILEHLRDLKDLELQARNVGGSAATLHYGFKKSNSKNFTGTTRMEREGSFYSVLVRLLDKHYEVCPQSV